jgi:hypothetical protein
MRATCSIGAVAFHFMAGARSRDTSLQHRAARVALCAHLLSEHVVSVMKQTSASAS